MQSGKRPDVLTKTLRRLSKNIEVFGSKRRNVFSACISIHSWRFLISCIHSRHRHLTFSYPTPPCEFKGFTLLSPFHVFRNRTEQIRERVKGEKQVWVHTEMLIVNGLRLDETSECSMAKVQEFSRKSLKQIQHLNTY